MNIKISVAFYTVIAIFQKKIKKTILFLIHQKKKLEIYLTKEVKHMNSENYKALMREFESDTNKWKDCTHRLEKIISLRCPYYPKLSIDSVQALLKYK